MKQLALISRLACLSAENDCKKKSLTYNTEPIQFSLSISVHGVDFHTNGKWKLTQPCAENCPFYFSAQAISIQHGNKIFHRKALWLMNYFRLPRYFRLLLRIFNPLFLQRGKKSFLFSLHSRSVILWESRHSSRIFPMN